MSIASNGTGYYISAVRFNMNHTGIESVRLTHPKTMKEVGDGLRIFPKEKIIRDIESGTIIYRTLPRRNDSSNPHGCHVNVVTGIDEKYLRSDDNDFVYDCLESVPEF